MDDNSVEENQSTNDIQILPYEIKHHITTFLDLIDLCRLSCVSKEWKVICDKSSQWTVLLHTLASKDAAANSLELYHKNNISTHKECYYKHVLQIMKEFSSWQQFPIPFVSDPPYSFENASQSKSYVALGGDRFFFNSVHIPTGKPCIIERMRSFEKEGRKFPREIKYLLMIQGGPGIPKLLDYFQMKDSDEVVWSTLVFEARDSLRFRDYYPQLNKERVRWIVYNLLKSLRYVHSLNLAHRDVKPPSVEVSADFKQVWLLNWYFLERADEELNYIFPLNKYVASRYFKSPELLLNCKRYDPAKLDMWGVGCVLAGMIFKEPFFRGQDLRDMLIKIIKVLGTEDLTTYCHENDIPVPSFITELDDRYKDRRLCRLENSCFTEEALDLAEKLLVYDPAKRLSAEEALRHPYFESIDEANPNV